MISETIVLCCMMISIWGCHYLFRVTEEWWCVPTGLSIGAILMYLICVI